MRAEVSRRVLRAALGLVGASGIATGAVATVVTMPASADTLVTSSTSQVNGSADVYFYDCSIGGHGACVNGNNVTVQSEVAWQEWKSSGGSIYYRLVQDYWSGTIPGEWLQGYDDIDQIQPSSQSALHYDGSAFIADVVPNGSGCYLYPAEPPWQPCGESNYNKNGHDYVNGTYVDSFFFYSSYVSTPDINWVEVQPLNGNP